MIQRILTVLFLSSVIASFASLASAGFIFSIDWMAQFFGALSAQFNAGSLHYWGFMLVVLIPTIGGLLVGLLGKISAQKRPQSIIDTIYFSHIPTQNIPYAKSFVATLASIISLGCGASLGQYAPLAHMGSMIGVLLRKIIGAASFTSTMALGCGVAAAISMVFSAPIAGLVFAHEVILRHYSLRSFAPITVAAVIGYIFSSYVFGKEALFSTVVFESVSSIEFLIFIMIGIVGAYVAIGFMKLCLKMMWIADCIKLPQACKPAMAGAILGVVAIWIPEVLGMGESVMGEFLIGQSPPTGRLIVIFLGKIAMTALCFGFGFAGGVFSPALFIGICLGALFFDLGTLLPNGIHNDPISQASAYMVCGMVAVASPVIGAPLTSILIIFELTRSYELAVAAMISTVFANLVSYRVFGRSLFDKMLTMRGIDLSFGRDKAVLQTATIEKYISTEYVAVTQSTPLEWLLYELLRADKTEGYVTDDEGQFLGIISLTQLLKTDQDGDAVALNSAVNSAANSGANARVNTAADYMIRDRLVFRRRQSIWSAITALEGFMGESIAVLDESSGRLMGVVYAPTILQGYIDIINDIRQEEHAGN